MTQTDPQSPVSTPLQADSAKSLADKLLAIIEELSHVMEEETPVILARDYSHQDLFIKRKQELTMDYQSVMKVFSEKQSLLSNLDKDRISQLRSSGQKLDGLTAKNADALRLAHHASEHLLKVVINEIRKDLHKASGYSGRGVMALAEAQQARPVSINQRV
jgi:hypothetical protein